MIHPRGKLDLVRFIKERNSAQFVNAFFLVTLFLCNHFATLHRYRLGILKPAFMARDRKQGGLGG